MQTNINEGAENESWGISDLKVYVAKCPLGCLVCNSNSLKACSLWSVAD